MTNETLHAKKKLIYSAISMGCILSLLCVCFVLLPNDSFSWFSKNRDIDGSGMVADVEKFALKVEYARCHAETGEAEEFVQIDWKSPLNFLASDAWYPGYSLVFKIKVTNVGDTAIFVDSMGFCAPTEREEVARIEEGKSYYFGTQLSAAVVAIDEVEQSLPAEHRLLALNAGEPSRVDVTLYEDTEQPVQLRPSESMQWTIRLTFVNEKFSQDVYQYFGKDKNAPECCQRRLFVTYVPVE